jgi:2,4-dienoyl-CoA reductase (NADPH2)
VYEHALRPGAIGALRLRNRVVMGSMHLGIEARDDGGAALAAFYVERVRGGAGLIVTGGSAISRAGAGGRNYSFINDEADALKLRRVAREVHGAGGTIALQLFHAGRYAFEDAFGLCPVAPSAVPSRFSGATPRALREDEIAETIGDFARGAARARAFGFDAVEVMASEGYLINQFLSPVTNLRDDAWGGDAERRMRFPLAVLRAIREAAGADFPVIFRISGADLVASSTTQEETLAFARRLAVEGVAAINVGVGWHESPVPTVQTVVPPGVWVRYAAAVARAVPVPVIAGNRITSLAMADRVLAEGPVAFVSMARPFLADPAFVVKSARGEEALVDTCIACNQACIDRSLLDAEVSCMVNPRAGRELELREERRFASGSVPRVAVVGGGPAGMEAARALAALGARVDLFEAEEELGGQFRLARGIPGKGDFGETIRYFTRELARLGVSVHVSRALTTGDTEVLRGFAAVVVATGVKPRGVALPGAELPHVVDYVAALRDGVRGQRVAIVGGGGIGVDLAHLLSRGRSEGGEEARFLAEYGLATGANDLIVVGAKEVAVMRRGRGFGESIGKSTRWAVLGTLRRHGVRMLPNVTYQRIVDEGVRIVDAEGDERLVEADAVVIAAGQEPNDALVPVVEALGVPFRVVGGAKDAGELNAVRAFEEGARAAHALVEVLAMAPTA